MAFIGIKTPSETAKLLASYSVPGKPEPVEQSHITLIYLGKDVPIKVLAKALEATYEVTSQTQPFKVQTSMVSCFPKGEDGVPVICPVESEALHTFRARIKAAYEAYGVPFSNKYPEYKPHVTLSYADEAISAQPIPTVEWVADQVILWGGNHGAERLVMTFPLSTASSPVASRVALRFFALLAAKKASAQSSAPTSE